MDTVIYEAPGGLLHHAAGVEKTTVRVERSDLPASRMPFGLRFCVVLTTESGTTLLPRFYETQDAAMAYAKKAPSLDDLNDYMVKLTSRPCRKIDQ